MSKKSGDTDMNYLAQILAMAKEAEEGEVNHITVKHEAWCLIFEGEHCNCTPEVVWGKPDEPDKADKENQHGKNRPSHTTK